MKKLILASCIILLVVGCAAHAKGPKEHRHADIVRSGMLRPGIHQQAFLEVWGEPERNRMITETDKDVTLSAGWNGFGGGVFMGKKRFTYQLWEYSKLDVQLLFDGSSLVNWKSDKTVEELKALAKPKPLKATTVPQPEAQPVSNTGRPSINGSLAD